MPTVDNQSSANRVFGDDVPLSVRAAAKELGHSVATMNRLIYGRKVASVKIGGRRKVRPSALKRYVDSHETTPV